MNTQYASLGRRFGANLIDNLISWGLIIVTFGGGIALTLGVGEAGLIVLLLLLAYPFVQWHQMAVRGATWGKRAVHIAIVDEATGLPVGYGRIFLRQLVLFAVAAFTIPLIVMAVQMSSDPRRQGWHDKVARTVVIHGPVTGFAAVAAPAMNQASPPSWETNQALPLPTAPSLATEATPASFWDLPAQDVPFAAPAVEPARPGVAKSRHLQDSPPLRSLQMCSSPPRSCGVNRCNQRRRPRWLPTSRLRRHPPTRRCCALWPMTR